MPRGAAVQAVGNTKRAHVSIRRAIRKILDAGKGKLTDEELDDIQFLVATEIVERRKVAS